MTKNFRLKQARIKSGLGQKELGDKIGVSQAYISGLEGSNPFSYEKAQELANVLDCDPDWLYYGDNSEDNSYNITTKRTKTIPLRKGVPYYNLDMTASIVRSFDDIREEPEFYVDISPLNDCTAFINIFGDSMFPMFKSGDKVGLKQLSNYDAILWGEAHLVITNEEANNMRTVKNVHFCKEDPSKIILRAANPDYPGDTPIPKSAILSLYIVKGKVQIYQL